MRRLLLAVLLAFAPLSAQAQEPSSDPRLPVIRYDAFQVIPLRAALNHQVTVVFGPGEGVDTVAIGDADSWQATLNQRGDTLVLKPLRQTGQTNMTVITDSRVYNFLLSATGSPTPDTPFTIRFDYTGEAAPPPAAVPPGRYRLSGARDVRPAEVRDDGVRTYMDWGPEQAIPAIFSVDERGAETLVEGQMQEGRFILQGVHARLSFRLDGKSGQAVRLAPRRQR